MNESQAHQKKEQLFKENMGLAYKEARKWQAKGALHGMTYEDLTQEALISLWNSLDSFNPEKSKISTYGTRCIRNKFINKFVTKRPILNGVPTVQVSDGEDLEYEFVDENIQEIEDFLNISSIKNNIKCLTTDEKNCIISYCAGDFKSATAQRFKKTELWVEVNLQSGIKKIKKILNKEEKKPLAHRANKVTDELRASIIKMCDKDIPAATIANYFDISRQAVHYAYAKKPLVKVAKRNDNIKKDYRRGVSVATICEKYNVDENRVYQLCKKINRIKLPECIKDDIKQMFIEGYYANEIAEKHGITNSTVFVICKGLKRDKQVKKRYKGMLSESQINTIKELYKNGKHVEDLAKEYGIGIKTIWKVCKGVNRKVKPKKRYASRFTNKQIEDMIEMKNKKVKNKEISKKYNISMSYLNKICREYRKKAGGGK
jgi:RNA polymerase sigma factor (sigma-70 family)